MKIIYTNSISNIVSSAGHLSTDYDIAKTRNNFPKQGYIPNAASATITVTCSGADAIYLQYLAESAVATFKDSSGSTISFTDTDGSTVTSKTYSNTYLLTEGLLLNDRTHWNDGIFIECPNGTNTVEFALTNSTNVQGALTGWVYGNSGELGRLQASSVDIQHLEYPQIRLGSLINSTKQINRITGDGTGTTDLQLTTGGNPSFTVTNMKLPIVASTIRAGKLLTTLNPSVGMITGRDSKGIQQERDSGLVYRTGEIRRRFQGTIQVLDADLNVASRVFTGLRMQPVAAEILGYQSSTSVFGYFSSPPSLSYAFQGSQLYNYTFEMVELI